MDPFKGQESKLEHYEKKTRITKPDTDTGLQESK